MFITPFSAQLQEYALFQDYSHAAVSAYRTWLKERNPDVSFWASRWKWNRRDNAGFNAFAQPIPEEATWQAVFPPAPFRSRTQLGHELDAWDWLQFREESLAKEISRLCSAIFFISRRTCFLHFGEFFSSVDAINSNVFFLLASDPHIGEYVLSSTRIFSSYYRHRGAGAGQQFSLFYG